MSRAGAVPPNLGSSKSQIPSLAVRLAALSLPNQGIGEVEVNRDLACAGGQLHGMIIESLSSHLSVTRESWPLVTAGWSLCLKWLLQGLSCKA